MEYQIDHAENEALDDGSRSVTLPKTAEFFEHLNNCYQGIALMREGLQIPEIYWHYHDTDTRDFTLDLIFKYINNKEAVETLIKDVSTSWNIDRMQKPDRKLIELGVTELLVSDLPHAVVVSEIIKLANKYSTDEGVKFINGILADVIKLLSDNRRTVA